MTKPNNFRVTLEVDNCELAATLTALSNIPDRLFDTANIFELLGDGLLTGALHGKEYQLASLFHTLGAGLRFIAQEEGEQIEAFNKELRRATEQGELIPRDEQGRAAQ